MKGVIEVAEEVSVCKWSLLGFNAVRILFGGLVFVVSIRLPRFGAGFFIDFEYCFERIENLVTTASKLSAELARILSSLLSLILLRIIIDINEIIDRIVLGGILAGGR